MPALPWLERQPIDPQRQYVAMASRLPLKSYRFIPGFMRDTMRIRRQLGQAAGLGQEVPGRARQQDGQVQLPRSPAHRSTPRDSDSQLPISPRPGCRPGAFGEHAGCECAGTRSRRLAGPP